MADRKAKSKKAAPRSNFGGSISNSVLCPICRTILSEPVTLPCNHVFCKPCFEGSMENASLVCPLCRQRVGSWYRRAKKDGKVVDQTLWSAIQGQYPLEIRNKLRGIENDIEKDNPVIVVASPGEIRREYEKEKQKHIEEQKKLREAEESASAMLIKKLKEEEELRKQVEESKLRLDALLAKKLTEELNVASTSKSTPCKAVKTSISKFVTLDRFLQNEDKFPNKTLLHRKNITSSSPIQLKKLNRKIPSTSPYASKTNFGCSSNKPIKITQFPSSTQSLKSYFGKDRSSRVLPVEHTTRKVTRESNLFADLDFRDFLGKMETRRKIEKSKTEQDRINERKTSTSGYKSSGSGDNNSDVIDQECKFYFKPIHIERRYHLPWKPPLKVPTVLGVNDGNVAIRSPSANPPVRLRTEVSSAFAQFLKDEIDAVDHRPKMSSRDEIKNEHEARSPKRALSPEIRGSVSKKLKFSSVDSSPFYGFDDCEDDSMPQLFGESARRVDSSPFYGFDILRVSESSEMHSNVGRMVERLNNICTQATTKETDINKNICNNKQVEASVSSWPLNGVKTSLCNNKQKSPENPPTKITLETPPGEFDSDSDENLHKTISLICDQSWEKSPKAHPKNGLKKSSEKAASDFKAVIDVGKVPRKGKKGSPSKPSPKKSSSGLKVDKRTQEEADFQYAKKLQAQFDLIRMPSRTRRGERQVTLVEMLSST